MKKWLVTGIIVTSLFTGTACSNEQKAAEKKEEAAPSQQATTPKQENNTSTIAQGFYQNISTKSIEHIHGIGYPGNMSGIAIATHGGLIVYDDGKWLETTEQNNDYMGFQAVKEGFYASGHPGEMSDLTNPLGLVRSYDGGKTVEPIVFYGESDFHYLAVGYNSHAMYVFNEQPNSKLKNGFYYSTDEGQTWEQSKLSGLSTAASMFAVHPDKPSVLAMSTGEGVYLSTDYGNNFNLFSVPVKAGTITFGAEYIIYSYTTDSKQGLIKQSLATSEHVELNIPSLDSKDSIMYVAQNPKNPAEMTFITMNSNIFRTIDEGKTWTQLVKDGKIQND